MADNKQYITQAQDNGVVMISEEVVCAIAGNAIVDVEGLVSIGSKPGIDLKNWGKGMKISISENNEITIDCSIVVNYGLSVVNIANAAQDAISNAVESMTGVKPAAVNVNVIGIARK